MDERLSVNIHFKNTQRSIFDLQIEFQSDQNHHQRALRIQKLKEKS